METVQQMSPVSMLALLNSNKAQRKSFCLQIIEQMENGEVDPIQVHVFLKNIEAIFKTLTDEKTGKDFAERYKDSLMDAVAKESGNSFEKYNAKFQVKEAGTKYDWSVCNDSLLNGLLEAQEQTEKLIKERQELLKVVPESGMTYTDTETGEECTIYRPAKSSSTTVSVTLS